MSEKVLMKGNEALAEGAIRAGCRFFAGYPITPQNEVPEYMSWRQEEVGGAFVQAESEIAAVNMLYGAAATGTRSMTSSSSPGISLKQEGISYLAGADMPCLIANIMRGGPGLGNIAGAQGDYIQATRGGGNGDYRLIVLAPFSVHELANFPKKAFELAEKYRMPAMILADGILGQMMEGMSFDFDPVEPAALKPACWSIGGARAEGKKRNMVYSYALGEGELEKMVLKRADKYALIERDEVIYEERFTEDAEILVVAYGISARASIEAINIARKKGIKVGLLRPITLWPFPTKRIKELSSKVKCILCPEMSLGQMIVDVKLAVDGKVPVYLHARPGAFFPVAEDIAVAIESALTGKKEQLFDLESLADKATLGCHQPENKPSKEGALL
ncbi:MAG: 3-methyl-2-oxobutanoate dehydrogenase subunit VorB [Elusimicrobiota bacterium]|jgi:2-oxoglutarate ferredoxin oxidoreductase subunit alpha|nr:3-methyl-2-oxobutanoate dehydrogenase subunit VorB [Elusimicrobiota bacterium]